jgi:coatomer subunit beta
LQHPNEYVRGVTLRFVCKLTEPELLEPLLPVVRACLEHTHPYVRRNAIFAVYSVYRTNAFMVPDGPELIEQVLAVETDASCQRNAFVMLSQTEPGRASAYFDSIAGRLPGLDTPLQLAVVEFMLSDASTPEKRAKYTRALLGLLAGGAASTTVRFEACAVLLALTAKPAAVKAAAQCYMDMAIRESDNNAKLVILERLRDLQAAHGPIVNEHILDVLRVLGCPDLEVRRRSLRLVLDGLNARAAEDTVVYLRKELAKLGDEDSPTVEYRRELLRAIHVCAGRFPKIAAHAVATWVEFFGQPEVALLDEVALYLKELLDRFPEMAPRTLDALLEDLGKGDKAEAAQALLWILGEFTGDLGGVQAIFGAVRAGLGELPLVAAEEKAEANEAEDEAEVGATRTTTKVLADGTYVTETKTGTAPRRRALPNLKQMLLDGHFALGASLAMALTKLVLRLESGSLALVSEPVLNGLKANVMLMGTSVIRLGLSRFPAAMIGQDAFDRIMLCIRVLSSPNEAGMAAAFTVACREAFEALIRSGDSRAAIGSALGSTAKAPSAKIGDPIGFRLATASHSSSALTAESRAKDIAKACEDQASSSARLASSLSKVVQLTGFSDPIYAESYVSVSHNDILLDILLVNQTDETLQAITVDLSTGGDLRVVDKPAPLSLAPRGFATLKVGIKVASTNNGLVYGCITYGLGIDTRTVVIANIPIDIVDYIDAAPGMMPEAAFRQAWVLLEWENKINIGPVPFAKQSSSPETALSDFLEALLRTTHLACITPGYGLCDGGAYLAANMHARSVFAEDVLANICLERHPEAGDDGTFVVSGHVRLRSKTQGIAIALGDKINAFVTGLAHPMPRA